MTKIKRFETIAIVFIKSGGGADEVVLKASPIRSLQIVPVCPCDPFPIFANADGFLIGDANRSVVGRSDDSLVHLMGHIDRAKKTRVFRSPS